MPRNPRLLPLCLLTVLSFATPADADVELPSVFSDHMVLQRDRDVPVWGRANPGESVTVGFLGESRSATAGADGRWQVTIPTGPGSGEPRKLTVTGDNEIVVRDVLVGEVWICSGQSNMEWTVGNSNDAAREIAAGKYPRIRHFKAAHTLANEPQFTVPGSWSVCDPKTVGAFSAVAYYFGRDLLGKLDVPIGLIGTNWGGSRAEPWTAPTALAGHPLYARAMDQQRNDILRFRGTSAEELERRYQEKLARAESQIGGYWDAVTSKDPGASERWYDPTVDASSWKTIKLPGLWEQAGVGLDSVDGLVWFRREVEIPEAWTGKMLHLRLGAIDDSDRTFFNGTPVGSTIAQHRAHRRYAVAGDLVKAGRAVIATLAYDTGGAGGFSGPAAELRLTPVDSATGGPKRVTLTGPWSFKRGGPPQPAQAPKTPQRDVEPGKTFTSPAAMYNGMIHPFVPYGIRGAIWYQGESNSGQAVQYRQLLPLMIRSWRDAWGAGDFPFGIVQLASFMAKAPNEPVQGGWAELRDAQLHTATSTANAGIVVASDIGDARDIHPRNKQDVGKRLALWARATVYGERGLAYSGPVFEAMEVRGAEVVLRFDHAAGLATRDGEAPAGFAIGDASGKFVWANARIDGETVIVGAEGVTAPTTVRFGWCNNLEHLNLVNGAGLPATPFRTDGP